MFKTTVTYKDFNNVTHTEELYFHMMAPEFADLQFDPTVDGDFGAYIRNALKSGEGKKIYTFFKLLIVSSYGRRSEDGSEFIKRPEFTEKFLNTRAYEEFFMWLILDPSNAAQFWNGIMPEALADKVAEIEAKQSGEGKPKKIQDMTREELEKLYLAKTSPPVTGSVTVEG